MSLLNNFVATKNTLGEVVLKWSMINSQDIETYIVIATFNGVTSVLGGVSFEPLRTNYEFVDRILNAYVGEKVYTLAFINYDGTTSLSDIMITYNKDTNIPLDYLI